MGAVMTSATDVQTLDVGELPTEAFGERAPLWWGVLLMVIIESTMFAMLFVTYLYVRNEFDVWPPAATPPPDRLPGLLALIALLVSAVPQWLVDEMAYRRIAGGDQRVIAWTLVAASVTGLLVLVPRAYEFAAMHARWDSNAYGSVVWTILGMHTFHVVTSTVETIIFTVYTFVRPLDEHHRVDLSTNSLYWYFVVGWWLPAYALLYFGPSWL
jgi:cytochrome c oxidase subunit I+III